MKRFTMILALLLVAALPMMAERVTPETARKVATTFLNNNGAKTTQLTDLSKEAGFPNLYIFNGNPGFVVMAADDCAQPILGYSLTGTFISEDMPDNVRGWLQGYNDEIQYAEENQMRTSSETAQLWKALTEGKAGAAKATTVKAPLIQTKWNQNKYYNRLCPVASGGPDGHAYSGCVATAMAQIMKYWRHPLQGIGSHSYSWNGQNLSADFSATTYDWDNMTDYYEYYYSDPLGSRILLPEDFHTPESIAAIATLMYHCGVSVDMNYGGGGSGTATSYVADALKAYFNYSPAIEYKARSKNGTTYYTDAEWIAMVKAELDANRPLEYCGQDPNSNSGHAFVCDGYDSNDYLHFNWGWAGHYDGYFSINNLNTGANSSQAGAGNGNYTRDQAAIFGIQPATIGEAEAPSLTAELVQATNTRNALLTWTTVSNATSYQLYYNTELIYSGTETSYIQEHIPYGTNTYFVRSVDASGNLSLPSNYEKITITFAAPANLTAEQTDDGISLSWTLSENAVAYNVYCNGIFIASNITTTTYTDNRTIAGTLRYYVKGVDELGDESDPSDATEIIVDYKSPTVEDLAIIFSDNNATLTWNAPNWCYPETASESLFYGSGNYSNCLGYGGSSLMCWGHRYLASELENYNDLVVYKVSFYAAEIGTYQCTVYKGTEAYTFNETQYLRPITPVADVSITTSQIGWIDIDLGETIDIDDSQDLWVFMFDPEYKGFPASFCSFTGHTEGCYFTKNNPITNSLLTYPGIAWLIKTCLTDGVYTYHLYDNGLSVEDNIATTNYTITSPTSNTAHQYTLKTQYYDGGESTASNMAGLTLGTASLNSLVLGDNDKMTVTEGSTLTVSGTLSNTDAGNLILKNGAQLIHSSEGVQATVLKDITPYTTDSDGWNFIASPVTENTIPSESNGFLNGTPGQNNNTYDLYYYDEPNQLWKNYENQSFVIENKKGYLYANGETNGTTLKFAGTLLPSNESITINNLSHSATTLNGFNLVGNPFACEAIVDKDFYVISGNTVTMLASTDRAIAPCEGIFVKATYENSSVTFTKATTSAKGTNSGNSIDLVVSQGKATTDRARVRFGEGIGLEKFSLDDQHSQISLWQNGQDYAVAYADGVSEMPISFVAAQDGTYSLSIENQSLDLDYLHLIDNMTGEDVDLLTTPSYTFEAKYSDYPSRFKLLFTPEENSASTDSANFAYYTDGEIHLVGETHDHASLQVVDMMGRIVLVGDAINRVSTSGITPGVYVLRLIDGETIRTQKIVIE